jgi:hypothetical protein
LKSRYIRTHREQLPRKRRSARLYGSFEDSGKWYKCWNCGFQFDISKISIGDGNGASCEDFPIEDTDVTHDSTLGLDRVGIAGVLIELGADDDPITSYYTPRKATVIGGCPFCGCKNQP